MWTNSTGTEYEFYRFDFLSRLKSGLRLFSLHLSCHVCTEKKNELELKKKKKKTEGKISIEIEAGTKVKEKNELAITQLPSSNFTQK